MISTDKIIVIAGPTGSGKSSMAIKLAQKHNGEIISADSMQLYRGLDIGTAKVSKEEQLLVKHHLIDIYDINVKSDVFKFVDLANEAIKTIHAQGKTAIICGGTGFYIKSLLYGLDDLPGDDNLRAEIEEEFAGEEGFERLKTLMAEIDPLAFEKYQNYHRKLIRALEVFRLTNKSLISLQAQNSKIKFDNLESYWINHERDILKQRIRERVILMLENGWIPEAEKMLNLGLLSTPSAHQALGYKQIASYLNKELTYDQLIEKINTATWQFARRQITWFRHQHPESTAIERMPSAT